MDPLRPLDQNLFPEGVAVSTKHYPVEDLQPESPIQVGMLPDRKQPAIYEVVRTAWVDDEGRSCTGARIVVLAYFRNVESMRTFLSYRPRVSPVPLP
jgi:hypothetical protein